MAEPRKIFRIEQTARPGSGIEDTQAGSRHTELMAQIGALRAMLAAAGRGADRPEAVPGADRLSSELNLIAGAISGAAPYGGQPVEAAAKTRIAHELDAVVETAEQATQKILAAAEEIDQAANNLSAALTGKLEQGMAQDIRDLVVKIFEACNFQDLAGQRVAKVMATLNFIEDYVTRVLDEIKHAPLSRHRNGAQLLHGPRLDIDRGHASQHDVDAIFGG
jgi:chemotaxis protein CheZ